MYVLSINDLILLYLFSINKTCIPISAVHY